MDFHSYDSGFLKVRALEDSDSWIRLGLEYIYALCHLEH